VIGVRSLQCTEHSRYNPEYGNRSNFRNILLFCDITRWTELKNSAIRHDQNPSVLITWRCTCVSHSYLEHKSLNIRRHYNSRWSNIHIESNILYPQILRNSRWSYACISSHVYSKQTAVALRTHAKITEQSTTTFRPDTKIIDQSILSFRRDAEVIEQTATAVLRDASIFEQSTTDFRTDAIIID
jgi:hypothetical protein